MFKKSQRFSFKKGATHQKLVTHLFILKYEKSDNPAYAVVSGKVVSKKAVERNRAKRIFLTALKEFLSKNDNKNTLVFFLRRPFVEYEKSAIMKALNELPLNSKANIMGELENSIRKVNS